MRAAVVGAALLALLATTGALAQDHAVMSLVWPTDLVEPTGESWVSDRSDGAAKAWFRRWVRAANVPRPGRPIDARFAYPPTASIVKLTIDAQGRLTALALVRGSGMAPFDDFVLRALEAAGNFLPPPPEVLAGRETVAVVAQFAAGYTAHSEDGRRLFGMPEAVADAPARPYDAVAWKQFEQGLIARVREDLRTLLSPPKTPVDLLLVFEYGDGAISDVKVGRSTADRAFTDLALARARAIAPEFRLPDRSSLSGMGIPLHFEPAAH